MSILLAMQTSCKYLGLFGLSEIAIQLGHIARAPITLMHIDLHNMFMKPVYAFFMKIAAWVKQWVPASDTRGLQKSPK